MFNRLREIEQRYEELSKLMSDPEVVADHTVWQKHAKAHAGLSEVVQAFRGYRQVEKELQEAENLLEEQLDDPEFQELVAAEAEELRERKAKLQERLKLLLLPKDPNDEKNVIMEIRAGAGGEEAALFAGDLFRMYSRYTERQGWKTEVLSTSCAEMGGFKEIIFLIEGHGAFSRLKYESGVHRVQRIPTTESGGRIHTSTATVAVLPEAEEVDVQINPQDLRVDVFCSSGPGGQSVNTTQSAVRITHLPSGLVISCQDEKSQHKNKDKALKVLRARLLDLAAEEQQGEVASVRRSQVGTGDRSERIRTYNYPQSRVTDHRINLTMHKLPALMDGELTELLDRLTTSFQAEQLKKVE